MREVNTLKKMDPSKIVVTFTEWVSRMAILNLSWILFSLPVVTIIPATDALFNVMNQLEEERVPTESVFQLFRSSFKREFKSSYAFGLPAAAVGLVFIVDTIFLNAVNDSAAWFQLFKYALYTLFVLFLIGVLFSYPLSKRVKEKPVRQFLMGLMLAVGNPLISLGMMASLVALIVVFLYWPAMIFFFSVSGVAWLSTKAVHHAIKKVEKKQFSKNY